MVRPKEDHKAHLHRIACSNLPLVPRKSWECYVAILQPGIPLEKCEHADFLWMKVKVSVTIEKILTIHLKRTGRNSVLMDGGIGLTIDTKIKDMDCLGLGVYTFWEIVKVEGWWEYTVQPMGMDIDERLWRMEERRRNMWQIKSSSTKVPRKSGLMRDETREWGLPEKRTSKREGVETYRVKFGKRKRESEDETDETDARRKRTLDDKLEVMRLKNQNPPPAHALATLDESTNVQLRQHEKLVNKQRGDLSANEKRLGRGQYKEMLQRFEISWERQRQDIINSDPQFRRSKLTQESLDEGTKDSLYQTPKDERLRLESYEKEWSLCLEAIQEELSIATRHYPQSSFTIRSDSFAARPDSDVVHLRCEFCPNVDIHVDQASPFQVAVEIHQTSIDHIDQYLGAMQKKLAEQSEGKKQRKKFTSDDIKYDKNMAGSVSAALR
ncbi:hypothetical protein EYC80_006630 [Monilinia laxa]|uniref:Uncharacterized protein n=1 Tax=Monilinia laxa TaxID=61186 RepID=A0A5N6JSJ1_MONLA|nr:hypothetical protein EYC80_006630 [Monilinia laxa]